MHFFYNCLLNYHAKEMRARKLENNPFSGWKGIFENPLLFYLPPSIYLCFNKIAKFYGKTFITCVKLNAYPHTVHFFPSLLHFSIKSYDKLSIANFQKRMCVTLIITFISSPFEPVR